TGRDTVLRPQLLTPKWPTSPCSLSTPEGNFAATESATCSKVRTLQTRTALTRCRSGARPFIKLRPIRTWAACACRILSPTLNRSSASDGPSDTTPAPRASVLAADLVVDRVKVLL